MRAAAMVVACCCACLGGHAPHYDYFVLTATSAPKSAPRSAVPDERAPTVGVSRLTLPRYLDRESIVTRVDDYRLAYSTVERWAEPLDEALMRTLRQDLANRLVPDGITVPSHAGAPTYDLQVEILRFERRGSDRVELWARWTLRASGEPPQTREARIDVALAGPTTSAATAALSEAVARLATGIATQLRTAEVARASRTSQ